MYLIQQLHHLHGLRGLHPDTAVVDGLAYLGADGVDGGKRRHRIFATCVDIFRHAAHVSSDVYQRLAAAVEQAKRGSPLRRVTIVVPTFAAGRDVLKYLGRHGGAVNVEALTVGHVIEKLSAPHLTPRTALRQPILEASTQRVLADSPGVFADVADQAATARALAAASWTLSAVASPSIPDPTPMVAGMLRIHRAAITAVATRYHARHEAKSVAIEHLHDLGAVLVFLPDTSEPAFADLVALLQHSGQTIDPGVEPVGSMVVHASDADDEVRSVARMVRRHLSEGVLGHRIGVFYAASDPYLQAITEHFGNAGIVFAGPRSHSLVDRPTFRSLMRLLDMDPDVMPRRELLAVLAERAMRWIDESGEGLSQRRIERLTRKTVQIVGGQDWERLSEVDHESPHRDTASRLHSLVTSLRSDIEAIQGSTTWVGASKALVALIDRYFPFSPTDLPQSGRTGDIAALRAASVDIGDLDGIAPHPSMQRISEALHARAESTVETVGTFGSNVSIGPIGDGVGRDLDVCIIVGAAEGILPAPRREDPLLPTSLTGRSLADEITGQRRQLFLAMASGQEHRIVTFPRGSLRGGAEKVPSRWILPTLSALAETPVDVVRWREQTHRAPGVVAVESFDAATQRADPRIGLSPASGTEWRLRALADVPATDRRSGVVDSVVRTGMEMRSDRLKGRFTRFNGNVSNARRLVTYFDKPVPPTRLEEWVGSPYRFFVRTLLGVDALPDPDDVAQIDAMSRGELIHEVLERFVQDGVEGRPVTLARLLETADSVLGSARLDAPGWLPQLWEKDSAVMRRDLKAWFTHDSADRHAGWEPVHAERAFGRGEDVVELDLGHATVRFEGKIDRLDRNTDDRIRVTDYKTGTSTPFRGQSETTPTDGGTKFQLPVYGLFARSIGSEVTARYWFVSVKSGFTEVGYPVTEAVLDVLRRDITVVHDAVRSGYFPPRPPQTHWADGLIDLIGRAGLERSWTALENIPELADYVAILGE